MSIQCNDQSEAVSFIIVDQSGAQSGGLLTPSPAETASPPSRWTTSWTSSHTRWSETCKYHDLLSLCPLFQRMHVLQDSIALQTAKSQSEASETDNNHTGKTSQTDDKRLKRKQKERETPKRKIDSKRRKLKLKSKQNTVLMSND